MRRFNLCRLAALVVAAAILISTGAAASDLKAVKNERLTVENQIKDTIQVINEKEKEKAEKEQKQLELEEGIASVSEKLAGMEFEYAAGISELGALRERLDTARDRYETDSAAARGVILSFYKNSRKTYSGIIRRAANIFLAFGSISYASKIIDSDKKKIDVSLQTIAELESQEQMMLEDIRLRSNEIRDIEERLGMLRVSRAGVEREIRHTAEEIDSLDNLTVELKNKSGELFEEIRELQKNSDEYVGGDMLWPVPSSKNVVSYFGMRLHPVYKVRKMHYGIDIAASSGRNILAANDGIVASAGYITGYGYTVIINHGGGVSTLYAHSRKLLVKAGDLVFKGDLIALVGTSGLSTGPHLHFEVRIDGVKKNPLKYLVK